MAGRVIVGCSSGEDNPDAVTVAYLTAGAALDQQARVLSLEQRAGDSAGPEVDAGAGVFGDLVVDDDVGHLQAPAWPEDAVDLVEDGVLVGHEVDHAVGDHDVD